MKVTRSEVAMARSPYAMHEAQARTAIETIAETLNVEATQRDVEATRREWRAVLADRDDGRARKHAERERAAQSRRMTRRTHVRNIGRASVGMLATLATAAGAIGAALVRAFG